MTSFKNISFKQAVILLIAEGRRDNKKQPETTYLRDASTINGIYSMAKGKQKPWYYVAPSAYENNKHLIK